MAPCRLRISAGRGRGRGGRGESEADDEEDEEDEDAALFAALVQDRRAAAERAMQDPIDHADLELAVAGAGRFILQLSDTLDDAHGRLINWRKDELRTMWEFADAAHFFRCFHTDDLLVSLPKCDVSDLEKLLLDTSSNGQAGPLHIALMKLVWPRRPEFSRKVRGRTEGPLRRTGGLAPDQVDLRVNGTLSAGPAGRPKDPESGPNRWV